MTRLLFESMWILAAVLVAAQFMLIAIWSWRRSRGAGRAVWVGLAAIPVLLIVSAVVITPRERIVCVCRELAEAVELTDLSAIETHLSGDLDVGGLQRAAFVEHVGQILERFSVYEPRLSRFEVTFPHEHTGVATFSASCRVESVEMTYGWLPTRWRLTFRRVGDAWLVTKIESIPIPPLHLGDLDDIPH